MATIEQSEKVIMVEGDVEIKGSPTAGKRKSEALDSELQSPVKKQLKECVEGTDEESVKDGVAAVIINDSESNQPDGEGDMADSTSETETMKDNEAAAVREEGKDDASSVNEAAAIETVGEVDDGGEKTEEIEEEGEKQIVGDVKEDAPELAKEETN